jgi:hypothetical protein
MNRLNNRIIQRLRDNSRGFWRKYYLVIMIFLAAVLCDALSTIHFMRKWGPEAEIHLAIRWMSMWFGNILGPLIGALGKAIAGLLVAVYLRRFAIYILLAVSIISFWAAWYNVWGYKIYEPNILNWIPW